MPRTKVKELSSIILIAAVFFVLGSMFEQLNIFNIIKFQISIPQAVKKSNHNPTTASEQTLNTNISLNHSLNLITLIDSGEPLKFLVAGHILGEHNEDILYHPATTLLTNIELFNQNNLDMIVLLGDIVKESNEKTFENFTKNFLAYIRVPVFNAVGNHEIKNRELYIKEYGDTTFSFIYKEHLFIFLDSNIEPFSLDEKQIFYVEDEIKKAIQTTNVKSIHIFSHHVFYFKPTFDNSFYLYRTNEYYTPKRTIDYFISKILIPISFETPIFIYTGDVGAWCGNLSPYYKKFAGSNVTAIATGIGNCEEDSVVIVEEIDNQITLTVFSLVGKEMMPIESYDDNYWKNK